MQPTNHAVPIERLHTHEPTLTRPDNYQVEASPNDLSILCVAASANPGCRASHNPLGACSQFSAVAESSGSPTCRTV
jgi:hypothetical protein